MVIPMDNMIKENEKRIERFDAKFYLENKNYAIASALYALETTNEIQKSFFKKEENMTQADYTLKLYALLQGLFVSIDSLYALALCLTKSKSFININANKDLRELKYIRNDVVGHPANRILHSETIAYCILDTSSITQDGFSYRIYTKDSVQKKDISILTLLTAYYQEANALLDELYHIALSNKNKSVLEIQITNVLDAYYLDDDYMNKLELFIQTYRKLYPTSKRGQHRIIWRYEIILKLQTYQNQDKEKMQVVYYCIGSELSKMYELIFQTKYNVKLLKKIPSYIVSFYRFMNKNKDLYSCLSYMKSMDHPYFLSYLNQIYERVKKNNIKQAQKYLDMIKEAYAQNEMDLVYALALPIKEYKRK